MGWRWEGWGGVCEQRKKWGENGKVCQLHIVNSFQYLSFSSLRDDYKFHVKRLCVMGGGIGTNDELQTPTSNNPVECMDFYILALGPEASTPEFAVNLWRKISIVLFCLHTDTGPTRTNWSWISILSKIAHHAHYASKCESTCYCRLMGTKLCTLSHPKVSPLMMTPPVVFLLSPLAFLVQTRKQHRIPSIEHSWKQWQQPQLHRWTVLRMPALLSQPLIRKMLLQATHFRHHRTRRPWSRRPNQMSISSRWNHPWRRPTQIIHVRFLIYLIINIF